MFRPQSIADVARTWIAEPEVPRWKALCEFLDEFYEVDGTAEMLAEEPCELLPNRTQLISLAQPNT